MTNHGMRRLYIASKNKGKVKEIQYVLKDTGIKVLSLSDAPEIPDIPETGTTFEENAFIKAKAVYDILNAPVLADDSGLEVDYLNGAPGVYSSRYAGENATDEDNCSKLLSVLSGVENRAAGFRCVLVLYDGTQKKIFNGVCRGTINHAPKGGNGFGYDPLFIPEGFSETFAELGPETKNKISHRGKALARLREYLAKP
jgi:XTP/dITP diphosphohydrolase